MESTTYMQKELINEIDTTFKNKLKLLTLV